MAPFDERYLAAKRTVDDRALNRRVWDRLAKELSEGARVLDVGAGIGTGAERMLDWGLLAAADYTAVDASASLLEAAKRRLAPRLEGRFVVRSLTAFAEEAAHEGQYDLVVAQAFIDLMPLESGLDELLRVTRPGGLLYLPITFDGETVLEPGHPHDEDVLTAYHGTMKRRGRTGRRLFHALRAQGADVLAIGSSDWLVTPVGRSYPDDEAYFLSWILDTIAGAVDGNVREWTAERGRQLAAGELVYMAHQVDAVARKASAP